MYMWMLRAALFIFITFFKFENLELAKMSKIRQWLNKLCVAKLNFKTGQVGDLESCQTLR